MKFNRMISMLIVISIMMSTFGIQISAADTERINNDEVVYITAEDFLKMLEVDDSEILGVRCDSISLISASQDNSVSIASIDAETNVLDVPAIVATFQNEDGTKTERAYFSLIPDDNGNLVSGLEISAISDGITTFAYSPYVGGYTVTLDATYSSGSMSNGMAYAPVTSKLKITGSSSSISDCVLYTLLTGQYLVSNLNNSNMSYTDAWPYYEHTYSIGSPVLNYQYSVNDYALYTNSYYEFGGYFGKHIYIVHNGYGSYLLKCQFTYNSTMYTALYGIYNYTSYSG